MSASVALRRAAGVMHRGVMRQLLQQKGIAARLARQREPLGRGDARLGGNQRRHDVPRLVLRHRLERQGGAGRRSRRPRETPAETAWTAISSVRRQASIRRGGGSGGRNRASSKSMLSASAQCRSSMCSTSACRSAIRVRSSRSAENARRRCADGSGSSDSSRARARHRLDLQHHGKRARQGAGLRRDERRRLRRRERAQVRHSDCR